MPTLIIDTDCGIDDAIGLMAALSSPSVEMIAITCVAGNTSLANVVTNVSKVLKVCRREEVPIYAGCRAPFARENNFASDYHGNDGLGECPLKFEKGPQAQGDRHAAQALIDLSRERKGEIDLVLLGPCTNLALAHHIDPNVTSYYKEILCMGGNVEGRGNVTAGAEFNFATDPEAAHVLIHASLCPVKIIPWETVIKNSIPWHFYERLVSAPGLKAEFLKAICKYTEPYFEPDESKCQCYELGDFLAVLAAIQPRSVTETTRRRLAVELRGEHTSGQIVQAWSKELLPNVRKFTTIVLKFDSSIVKETLLSMLGADLTEEPAAPSDYLKVFNLPSKTNK